MRTSYGFLIGLLLTSLPAFAQWGSFTTDTLDGPVSILQRTTNLESLEIDASGFLHAVWTSERTGPPGGFWILYNTTRPSGEWMTVPDTVNTNEQIAYSPVMALTLAGDPIVAFEANEELISALLVGGEWSHQTICGPPTFLCCPTIAVDVSGIPHLAWIGEEEFVDIYYIGYLRVVWGSDPQLLMDTQLGLFGLGADPKIAVSSDGIAHITFRGGAYEDYHVEHAYNNAPGGANWTIEPLFTPNQEDLSSDIVTRGGEIHVLVCGDDGWGMPGHVYYFVKSDSGWSPPEDVSGRLSATGASLALDGGGVPHALLMELSGNMLTGNVHYFSRYPVWNGSTLIGEDHFYPCLRLDPEGYGHALMSTGGNTGSYGVLHLRSENPLSSAAQISITPTSLDFGVVPILHDSTQIVTISNPGTAALQIDSVVCSLDFEMTFPHLPLQIQPGEFVQPGVTFSPGQPRPYNGECLIFHNALGEVTALPVTGVGALGGAPGPFARLLPADSAQDPWHEIPDVLFVWSESVDPDQDSITYILRVFDPIGGWDETFTTSDTTYLVSIPIPVLDEVIAFYWTVLATDGHYTTDAENGTGVFFVTIENADDPLLFPRDFDLAVYPNPFNSAAMLAYSLPRAMNVNLSVYDVQGRRVATLVDGLIGAGAHRIAFDGRALSTGVYFARLETAHVIRTQKLLLLK